MGAVLTAQTRCSRRPDTGSIFVFSNSLQGQFWVFLKIGPNCVKLRQMVFRNIKSTNVRRCAHVLVFTTSRSLKNQLQFAGLPKSHADGFHEEDALEDSTITQHCCQEFLVTLSRRSSQHHVGCKLLAAENPHSVRYRTARRTRPWNLSSKTRATEGCMRPQHLMSARSS